MKNKLLSIMAIGFLLRIIFTLFVAKYYFNRENIFVDGDTMCWGKSFENLLNYGTYTFNFDLEYGYFARMPGYSFFMGFFYLITGKNWEQAFHLIVATQIILDTISIYLFYKITRAIFNHKTSIISALVYAFYPFIIVWNPVVYSEAISIFFLLLSLHLLLNKKEPKYFFLAGIIIALACLNRPQILILIGSVTFYVLLKKDLIFWKNIALIAVGFFITYSPWPIRNYVNHNKIVITQDLRGFENWDEDVISFMQYLYSVKSEWEPEITQLLQNKNVDIPQQIKNNAEDSLAFTKGVYLAQTCGNGFTYWPKYVNDREKARASNCSEEVKNIFDKLRQKQIEANPLEFYLLIPLQNLKKGIFKLSLTNPDTTIKKAASLLFIYRTFLILLGFLGIILMIKTKELMPYGILIGSFFIMLYVLLCFGTGVQFRNIEMRYFLQADILLLIPASYIINNFFSKIEKNV